MCFTVLDFGNNFFETTFLLRTGELARALLLYIHSSNYINNEKRGRGDAPVARYTCRVAVRSPDERSEELSRSESRKRVRDQVG